MHMLDRKLFRDVRRLWAQVLAIAFVVGGGVATLFMAVGSYRSLDETRTAYYERYRFADVFAVVTRAPKTLVQQVAEIPGVAAVDARIARLALLDIPNYPEPATAQVISLPDIGEPQLNRLYMRLGARQSRVAITKLSSTIRSPKHTDLGSARGFRRS